QGGGRVYWKREPRRKAPKRLLDGQPCVLEVDVAGHPSHDIVVDLALSAQLENGCPLRVEELAQQPLVGLRPLLDRAVVVRGETGCKPISAEIHQSTP